jgi:hypothetical protein
MRRVINILGTKRVIGSLLTVYQRNASYDIEHRRDFSHSVEWKDMDDVVKKLSVLS